MAFQVDITEPALADAEDYVRFIRDVKKEPDAAERWFRELVEAIYSLEQLPERCPVIPEHSDSPSRFVISSTFPIGSSLEFNTTRHETGSRLPRVSRPSARAQ